MPIVSSKKDILDEKGYRYNFTRMIYVNRSTRKVFSVVAVEDNTEEWLAERIAEENGGAEWRFYFNSTPSERVKQELLSELA